MFSFIKDFIAYPFDNDKKNNKFSRFMIFLIKEYPAFLWIKPTWQRIVSFPLLVVAKIFEKK